METESETGMRTMAPGTLPGRSIGRTGRNDFNHFRADHIHVTGLTIQWVYMCGQINNAHLIILSEMVCHDSWIGAFQITGTSSDNTLRYLTFGQFQPTRGGGVNTRSPRPICKNAIPHCAT